MKQINKNMPLFQLNRINFLIMIFVYLLLQSNCQQNTHQNVTFEIPSIKPFKMFLKPNDQVEATIFNTNTKYFIAFMSEDRQILQTEQGHCFQGERCQLKFTSKWNVIGWIFMQIYYSHEYSYEIKVNNKILKTDNIFSLVQAQTFIYPYLLQPKVYQLSVYYQSQIVNSLSFKLMDKQYTIRANRTKSINWNIKQYKPLYQFVFELPDMKLQQLTQDFSVKIYVLIPNQMIKNCNGYNLFNQKIKACGSLQQQSYDSLIIDRYGIFSHFTIHKTEVVKIKLTVVEINHFIEEFNQTSIQAFLVHSSDPKAFKTKSIQWILTNYQTQYQKCIFTDIQCSFTFHLQPGRYSFLPFLPSNVPQGPFVYLFERYDNKDRIRQSYYSVFAVQYENTMQQGDYYNFNGVIMQLIPTSSQLMQISFESRQQLVMIQYNIYKRNREDKYGQKVGYFLNVQNGIQNSFSVNMSRIQILTQLQMNQPHLLFVRFHSRQYFVDNVQDGYDKYEIYESDPRLQNTTVLFKLINGRFVHKKIDQIMVQDDYQYERDDNNEDDNNDQQSRYNIMMILLIVLIIILLLILMIMIVKNIKNKRMMNELIQNQSLLLSSNNISSNIDINNKVDSNNIDGKIIINNNNDLERNNQYHQNNLLSANENRVDKNNRQVLKINNNVHNNVIDNSKNMVVSEYQQEYKSSRQQQSNRQQVVIKSMIQMTTPNILYKQL